MFSLQKRLWKKINKARRIQLLILLPLMLLASFAEVLSIGAVLPFLGVLTDPAMVFEHAYMQPLLLWLNIMSADQILLPATIVFICATLFSGFIRLLLLWKQTHIGHAIGADLSLEVYKRTLYQPYTIHVSQHSSEIIAAVSNKINQVVYNIILPALVISSSSVILIMIATALFFMNPMIALLAFVGFGLLYSIILLSVRKKLLGNSVRISRMAGRVIKVLQEGLGGIRDVLLDGTQDAYCALYKASDVPMRQAQASNQVIGGSPRFIVEALGIVMIASLAYTITSADMGVDSAIPLLGALALGAQRMLPLLQQVYASWSLMRGSQAALSDALELLEQKMPDEAKDDICINKISFDHDLTVSGVSFRYEENSAWVLRSIDIQIKKGMAIGIIGTTGSGKSTFVDILMGLLYPNEGSISVDGEQLTSKNMSDWQKHVAHVPQAIFLADSSIAENIAFGVSRELIDFEKVHHAAQRAQLSELIESWDNGYNTVIGESGVRLSGGQRQRIGIARALYKQADFIVFDEATSALDNQTERDVIDSIDSLGEKVTVLMIAHRLTSLRECDQIIEISQGEVSRVGSYNEMIGS